MISINCFANQIKPNKPSPSIDMVMKIAHGNDVKGISAELSLLVVFAVGLYLKPSYMQIWCPFQAIEDFKKQIW